MKIKQLYLTAILLAVLPTTASAVQENDKLWIGAIHQADLTADKRWKSFIFLQSRLIKDTHPWQQTYIEGLLGYQLKADQSFWFGYRWSGINPNNRFYYANRVIEHFIYILRFNNDFYRFNSRTRLEQIKRSDEKQISLRFRERLAWEVNAAYFKRINPYFFDEAFFELNKTDYTSHRFFSENRLFIGFNLLMSKTSWWEIGYINQFEFKTPRNPNMLSNILSITYYT